MDQWEAQPTTKLQAVITLCTHHLATNNAPPMIVDEDGDLVVDTSVEWPPAKPHTERVPDKIVLYSAFTKYNHFIKVVSAAGYLTIDFG